MQRRNGAKIKVVRPKNPLGINVGIIIIAAVSLGLALLCGLWFRIQRYDEYCDTNGEVFTTIQENAEIWAKQFPTREGLRQLGDSRSLSFYIPTGKQYVVVADYSWEGDRQLLLYVPTIYYPRRAKGAGGYVYTTTGDMPRFASDDELIHLDDKIYCYRYDNP